MKLTSPLKIIHWVLAGLSVVAVLGSGLNSVRPIEDRPAFVAPYQIADGDGQETHGKNGGKRQTMLIADGSGQETHGGKGGKGIA